jgi:hypothetical protein
MRKHLLCAPLLALVAAASAAIVTVDHGTGVPPATLGPYAISALPFDSRPVVSDVTDAPGSPPLTGDLGFSIPMSLRDVRGTWGTWSHGYLGRVYFTNWETSATMTLPPETVAFLLYVEPNPFSWQTITATAQDGTSLTRLVHGDSGAAGFGFYGTDGDTIESIHVEAEVDWAWGEFYGAIPEPASLGLLGLGGIFLLHRR